MAIAFIEYKVLPEHRAAYSEWMKRVRADYPDLETYEGADQPGLFVELWSGMSREKFERLKAARLRSAEEHEPGAGDDGEFDKIGWQQLHQWVPGGAAKLHIWLFEKVR
jgi:hypothetical protein